MKSVLFSILSICNLSMASAQNPYENRLMLKKHCISQLLKFQNLDSLFTIDEDNLNHRDKNERQGYLQSIELEIEREWVEIPDLDASEIDTQQIDIPEINVQDFEEGLFDDIMHKLVKIELNNLKFETRPYLWSYVNYANAYFFKQSLDSLSLNQEFMPFYSNMQEAIGLASLYHVEDHIHQNLKSGKIDIPFLWSYVHIAQQTLRTKSWHLFEGPELRLITLIYSLLNELNGPDFDRWRQRLNEHFVNGATSDNLFNLLRDIITKAKPGILSETVEVQTELDTHDVGTTTTEAVTSSPDSRVITIPTIPTVYHISKTNEHKNESDNKDMKINELTKERNALRLELDKLRPRSDSTPQERAVQTDTVNTVDEGMNTNEMTEIKEMESKINHMGNDKQELLIENNELKKKYDKLQKELVQLRQHTESINTKQKSRVNQQSQVSMVNEHNIEDLLSKLKAKDEVLKQKKIDLNQSNKMNDEKQSVINNLSDDYHRSVDELENIGQLLQDKKNEISVLKEEKHSLMDNNHQLKLNLDECNADKRVLSNNQQLLLASNTACENGLSQIMAENKQVTSTLSASQNKLSEYHTANEEYQSEMGRVRRKVRSYQIATISTSSSSIIFGGLLILTLVKYHSQQRIQQQFHQEIQGIIGNGDSLS